MVHGGSQAARAEEVDAVQVGDVHTPAGTEKGDTLRYYNAYLSILMWCKQSSKARGAVDFF